MHHSWWTGTITTSGLNYKQNRQSKWLLWILKLKMYKLIERVLPTHNQTTAEAVLLLPTHFLWQQLITPDNCCTAWTAPADMSGKKQTNKKKHRHTHTLKALNICSHCHLTGAGTGAGRICWRTTQTGTFSTFASAMLSLVISTYCVHLCVQQAPSSSTSIFFPPPT